MIYFEVYFYDFEVYFYDFEVYFYDFEVYFYDFEVYFYDFEVSLGTKRKSFYDNVPLLAVVDPTWPNRLALGSQKTRSKQRTTCKGRKYWQEGDEHRGANA